MDLRALQQRLEKEIQPLYVLLGDDSFLVSEAVAAIKVKALTPGSEDFNFQVFDASETPASTICDAVEVLPMMGTRRLVICRGIESFKDKDWEVLYPLFDRPVESTTLVLTGEEMDRRKKSFKKLADTAFMVELKRPYENQLQTWIEYLAYRNGVTLSRDAAQMLKQFVGVNLSELNNEIGKLKNYIGERTAIEAQDVLTVVSQSRVDRIFDLTDAIGRRDCALALQSLANLLENGQNEVGVLSMITRHIRILSHIREGQREGLTGGRLSAKAGVPQFLLGQYVQQVSRWNEDKISMTYQALQDTDRALKSSGLPSHVWLENFILKTCDSSR
jgi:DNA polymerase-3 subunit delta